MPGPGAGAAEGPRAQGQGLQLSHVLMRSPDCQFKKKGPERGVVTWWDMGQETEIFLQL